ncbi:hypothetical protein [Amaricoccus sp.]|uniref:hypothetical protein n=1 Tax=Amaricoccus sp. TaxID=1872485 RepID=UPI002606A05C|nr:hypothetical protein [Amaricoccus sp.]HRO12611.1 hypothetical protein [Amaricoccus sp.]
MTETAIASYIETLATTARAASTAEQDFQKEAARRAAQLREARAFAWRRLNLVRATASAVRGAEGPEAVAEAGRETLFRESGLGRAAEANREVAERFVAVAEAVAAAGGDDPDPAADPAAALAAFEAWYAAARGGPFLALMEREVVELPLVEV